MNRVLEPEFMDDQDQALAYAKADFEEENQGFVNRFVEFYPVRQAVWKTALPLSSATSRRGPGSPEG